MKKGLKIVRGRKLIQDIMVGRFEGNSKGSDKRADK